MKKWPMYVAILSALVLTACVTINIYFPASAAERVADEIIEDIQAEDPKAAPAETDQQGSDAGNWLEHAEWVVAQGLAILVTDAHAAEADLSIDSPEIRKLQAAMKTRFRSLRPLYDSGAIGLTREGLVRLRDASAVPLKTRARAKQWVAAENRDRNSLYRAIADANGHPEWEADIRETFARRWVANANASWWYEAKSGWKQK